MNKIFKYTVWALTLSAVVCALMFGGAPVNSASAEELSTAGGEITEIQKKIDLPILMYHNIMDNKYKESTYEITANSLEEDLKWLKNNDYTAVNTEMLCDYVDTGRLPNKAIMLTFDDGFYSYMKHLPPLMEKYDMRCVVGVVGAFTKFNKNTTATEKYKYLDYDDMAELAKDGRIEIANHTFNNHSIKNGAKGISRRGGESAEEYCARIGEDINSLENALSKYGLHTSCYVYPYGLFSKESESVIKSKDYRVSLTCAEKVNKIGRNAKDLYLLGRFNRSHTRSAKTILTENLK